MPKDDDYNDAQEQGMTIMTMMRRNKGCPEETKARSRGSLPANLDSDWVPTGSQIENQNRHRNQNYGKYGNCDDNVCGNAVDDY